MLKWSFVLLILISLSSACKGQKNVSVNSDNSTEPKMELIVQDNYSGAELEEKILVENEKTLKKFYGRINRTRKPGLPLPEIDFSKNRLLIWCSGESTDNPIELFVSEETDETYFISKKTARKVKNTSALISPFYIYKIPLDHKTIVFE
ncbi:hypothetical protein [Maribacter sp. 2304DJ31-5]|uniref:hypothetical protein n=1 Tax=Maribacter sp. 2304DJ31-5 TaxID=3386273 RepID=UPI0039BD7540